MGSEEKSRSVHPAFASCHVINHEFVMIKVTVSVELNKCCSFTMFGFSCMNSLWSVENKL